MTREQYLNQRKEGKIDYLYDFYKEVYKPTYGNFLEKESFFVFIKLWPGANQALQDVTNYYDEKFTIVKLRELKTGNIITVL